MTPPTSSSERPSRLVPPSRLDFGGGYSNISLGNGAPDYEGGMWQVRIGHDFPVHPQHNFFLNGVFRSHHLTSEAGGELGVNHFGIETGYEGWVIPDQFSIFANLGLGTNIFYSPNIRETASDIETPLQNGSALALTLGGGVSIGRGILVLQGAYQPSFGLQAVPDTEFSWREGYNPQGYYFLAALDLARMTAAAGGDFSIPSLLTFAQGIQVGTLLDASYTYNFNNPGNGENQLRPLDSAHNRVMGNLAELSISRPADAASPFGFNFVFDVGENAGATGAADSFNGDYYDLQQLSAQVYLPIGHGVTFEGGKFGATLGPEVIPRRLNSMNSMTWGNSLALPYTHWGAKANVSLIPDDLDLTLGMVNGWDSVYGRTTGPAGLYGLSGQAAEWLNLGFQGIIGDDNGRVLSSINPIATIEAGMFNMMTSVIYTASGDNGPELPEGHFVAAMIQPCLAPHHHINVCARGEIAHDGNGARTGVEQTLGSVALAVGLRPVPEEYFRYFPLEIRPELRYDTSSADSFMAGPDNNPTGDMLTFGVSASLNFDWTGMGDDDSEDEE